MPATIPGSSPGTGMTPERGFHLIGTRLSVASALPGRQAVRTHPRRLLLAFFGQAGAVQSVGKRSVALFVTAPGRGTPRRGTHAACSYFGILATRTRQKVPDCTIYQHRMGLHRAVAPILDPNHDCIRRIVVEVIQLLHSPK